MINCTEVVDVIMLNLLLNVLAGHKESWRRSVCVRPEEICLHLRDIWMEI